MLPSPFSQDKRKDIYHISFSFLFFKNPLVLDCFEGMVFNAYYVTLVVVNTDNTSKSFEWAPLLRDSHVIVLRWALDVAISFKNQFSFLPFLK